MGEKFYAILRADMYSSHYIPIRYYKSESACKDELAKILEAEETAYNEKCDAIKKKIEKIKSETVYSDSIENLQIDLDNAKFEYEETKYKIATYEFED